MRNKTVRKLKKLARVSAIIGRQFIVPFHQRKKYRKLYDEALRQFKAAPKETRETLIKRVKEALGAGQKR